MPETLTKRAPTMTKSDSNKTTSTSASVKENDIKKYGYDAGGSVPELTQLKDSFPAYVIGTTLTMSCALFIYIMFPYTVEMHQDYYWPKIGGFLFFYYLFIVGSRWSESDSHVLYEQLWACNVGILMSVIGMFLNIPLFSTISVTLVAIDQIMWWVDISSYVIRGKFLIGVAAYITWPSTSNAKKITAFHHLWFMPLVLYTLDWYTPFSSFYPACILCTFLCCISRYLTPFHCLLPLKDGETEHRVLYLNINASYAFWKDVKLPLFQVLDHYKYPLVYCVFVTTLGCVVLNLPANLFLSGLLWILRTYIL